MHFTLISEGKTEVKALREFLKRRLDPKIARPIGLNVVKLDGWSNFVKEVPKSARLHLDNPKTVAVIGLIDLFGPTFYPQSCTDTQSRCDWAKARLEGLVSQDRYHQFFAVHEVEAWLFSDPKIFPHGIAQRLNNERRAPEDINGSKPPAKLLNDLYSSVEHRLYKKVTDGRSLFHKLDPDIAYEKCPNLRAMLDCMLALARQL